MRKAKEDNHINHTSSKTVAKDSLELKIDFYETHFDESRLRIQQSNNQTLAVETKCIIAQDTLQGPLLEIDIRYNSSVEERQIF